MNKALAAVCLVLAGCAPDAHGILAAASTGNLLDPPAVRDDALGPVRETCGEPAEASASLRRRPYVQSLGSDRATLVWTSTADAPQALAIWTSDGATREVPSTIESTRYLRDARQHVAAVGALEPATTYCYAVRDASGATVFGPSGFRTAPLPDAGERIEIAVLGDSGGGSPDQLAVAAQMRSVPLDFVLHVGDVTYPNGTLDELEAKYFGVYADLLSTVPLFPAIGDHDDATDAAGPLREVFDRAERFYSFDYGQVHVVVLDAFGSTSEQGAFLERDLAQTDAAFRIAVVHEPPYSSGWHGSNEGLRSFYGPIFERHGVQLVLSGDDHHYERSTPQDGVTYVVTGGGGYSVRPVSGGPWTAFAEQVFHFVHVVVEGDEMRLHAIDATGREFDGVVIPRG